MKDDDYEELSNSIVSLREEFQKLMHKLASDDNLRLARLEFAKVNHQKILEAWEQVIRETHQATDHVSGVFQYGKHVSVPDRGETFEKVQKLLKETENK